MHPWSVELIFDTKKNLVCGNQNILRHDLKKKKKIFRWPKGKFFHWKPAWFHI